MTTTSIPTKIQLFSGVTHGAFTLNEVLSHHKNYDADNRFNGKSADGIVFLCEHFVLETANNRIDELNKKIDELTEWISKTPYNIWQVLDKEKYFYQCRKQLLCMARGNYHGNFNPYKLK